MISGVSSCREISSEQDIVPSIDAMVQCATHGYKTGGGRFKLTPRWEIADLETPIECEEMLTQCEVKARIKFEVTSQFRYPPELEYYHEDDDFNITVNRLMLDCRGPGPVCQVFIPTHGLPGTTLTIEEIAQQLYPHAFGKLGNVTTLHDAINKKSKIGVINNLFNTTLTKICNHKKDLGFAAGRG